MESKQCPKCHENLLITTVDGNSIRRDCFNAECDHIERYTVRELLCANDDLAAALAREQQAVERAEKAEAACATMEQMIHNIVESQQPGLSEEFVLVPSVIVDEAELLHESDPGASILDRLRLAEVKAEVLAENIMHCRKLDTVPEEEAVIIAEIVQEATAEAEKRLEKTLKDEV